MADSFYVGQKLTAFADNGKTRPVSRVTLMLDDDNAITAGDDTGYEIVANCAYATQEMADAILVRMRGYEYQMYTADAARLDPAAELGDGVTADGVYGVLSRLTDDGGGYPDITAPGEAEMEDEFPTGTGPMTREFERKIAQTRATITRTADEINLRIDEINQNTTEELEKYAASVTKSLGELQSQIDGSIMTWFYSYEPTTANEPASLWTTDAEKEKHLGDVFYIVDNEEKGGQAYRWEYVDGAYRWALIEDAELAKALADAARAQDTADKKRRVFTSQPTPPYDEGDLWAGGPNGDLMRCKTTKTSGAYSEGDWEKASKYTDNSYAEQRYSELDQKIDSIKLTVSNGTGKSTLTLKAGSTELSSAEIVFSGFVTFEDLRTSGRTTISGGNITTDIIRDQASKNYWNLNDGTLVTNGMTANNITANGTFQCGTDFVLYLSNGTMSGWRNISGEGLSELAEINFTAAGTSQITGQTAYGMKMYATDLIMMQTPKIYIGDNSDPYVYSGVTTTVSKSFQVTVNNVTQTIGSVHLEFINGICVGCLVGGT